MKNIGMSLLLLAIFSCHGRRTIVISGLEGKPLPSFNMLLTDSITYLKSENIPVGQPFVLFYFSPFCPYCKAQVEKIKQEIKIIKDLQFYFIAEFPLYQIKQYDQHYGLSNYTNITLAQVRDTSFSKYYNIHGVPYMAVYNKQKKLKEVLLGISDVEVIKEIAFAK
jgi:thioredoxin-related protein